MISHLNKFWESAFGEFAPEAHNFKHEFKDRWVRFHSLPESKRYAESENEYSEILRRHNAILQELGGSISNLLVVVPEYSSQKSPSAPEPQLSRLFPNTQPWRSIDRREDEDDSEFYWHLHVSEVAYTGCEFNELFRLAADDKVRNIIIIGLDRGFVFHPYDGGLDVVSFTPHEKDTLKERHHEWLSSYPSGF